MTMYFIQYRYIVGNRRWKNFDCSVSTERAKDSLAFMIRNADAPVEGRIVGKSHQ